MWHLQTFTSSVEATRIRRLILEYDHSLVHMSARQMGHALRDILEIWLLSPKLKTLTFIPFARTGFAETRLDRHIQTKNQSKKRSQWVLRLIKLVRDPAPNRRGNWCERWEEEEQRTVGFLRRKLSEGMKEFRRYPKCRFWGSTHFLFRMIIWLSLETITFLNHSVSSNYWLPHYLGSTDWRAPNIMLRQSYVAVVWTMG